MSSAAVSWKLYNVVQASVELPRLARERLTIGAQVMHQDFLQVDYFGLGNESRVSDQSAYRLTNADILGYAAVRATDWLTVSGRFGGIPQPRLSEAAGPRVPVPSTVDLFSDATAPGIFAPPSFLHGDVLFIVDRRDHKGHPTRGGLYQFGAATYSDRDFGTYSFRRYEVEASQFVPLFTKKWILALHGREIFSDTTNGHVVPFYLMPSLGGKNTLRGYHDYRFHDNDMQAFNAECVVHCSHTSTPPCLPMPARSRRAPTIWTCGISRTLTASAFVSTTRPRRLFGSTLVTASRAGRCLSKSVTRSSDRRPCPVAPQSFRSFRERPTHESRACLRISSVGCALLSLLHGEGSADDAALGCTIGGPLAVAERLREA